MKPRKLKDPVTPTDPGFYKELIDQMSDGVYFVDRERRIHYWNEGACRLTGYSSEELTGRYCQDNILCHVDEQGRKLCIDGCPLLASIEDGSTHEARLFLRHKQGRRVPVLVQVQPLRTADGAIAGAIEIFRDDSAQYEARRKLEAMKRLAFLDHLTQMPNRRFLEMSLRTAMNEYQVHKDAFGVLMIDLDEFKAINDSFGHSFGDYALQQAGRTLTGTLRPTDVVGRWGGDEFLAIVYNVKSENLAELARRCAVLMGQTSVLDAEDRRVSLSISVGAALVRPGDTCEALIERADELMYKSRTVGRGRSEAG
ncbi:MAG: sensor domain-containing diguanylate cyclase [Terracidiphilus sp.]|jgi:diguanylate cyclase (GGDEF)-like protein/PAS domain S-box-containing protein